MSGTVFLVSPVAPAGVISTLQNNHVAGDRPLRLGLLDNGKFNAEPLLRFLSEQLQTTVTIPSIVRERKPSMSTPATREAIDRLVAGADVVISAMAD